MKKVLSVIKSVFTLLIIILAVCMMIFTIISTATFDRTDRDIFGYKAFVVLSDSMSATDFKAGDLILVKETDPASLSEGDIIAFQSVSADNYGDVITHKIRSITTDANGNPGFITYGTTTGKDDDTIVNYDFVIGKYQSKIPGVGRFFQFLKTTPGYIICILIPFLLLILIQGFNSIKLFRRYKAEQTAEIKAEREKLREEREQSQRMMEELMKMKQELSEKKAGESTPTAEQDTAELNVRKEKTDSEEPPMQ